MTKPKSHLKEIDIEVRDEALAKETNDVLDQKEQKEPEATQVSAEIDKKYMEELRLRIEGLEADVREKESQVKEEQDKALRSLAELENFKKRKEIEKVEFCKYANEKLILELLPVLDSFDRAVEHSQAGSEKLEDVLSGFSLIQKQFHSILDKLGVQPIESFNVKFDPHLHQAVIQEENKEVEPDTVIKVMQVGYKLNEKVIRPSMVVVSK